MTAAFEHRPVMVDRVVDLLGPVPSGVILDATVGGGGHSAALLAAHGHIEVVGLDQDQEALDAAAAVLRRFGRRVALERARFDQLTTTLQELGHEALSGAVFDLGVSSPQLDRADRGFSYRADGPLDMRMDRSQPFSADAVVNDYDEDDLRQVLARYGDERYAGRVARAIVGARPLRTTGELAEVVRDAIPAPARRRGGHPARRTFQAIRIEVNRELEVLPTALDQAIDALVPGGRCVAIAYHSGEDRIVKERFRLAETGGCTCPPNLPCACGAVPTVRLLKRGAERPSPAEVEANHRAESARLRAVEKLEPA